MNNKNFEKELALDLREIQLLLSELAKVEYQEKFVTAGKIGNLDNKIRELIKKVMEVKEKYNNSPMKLRGFSITFGAAIINSSASINFEF